MKRLFYFLLVFTAIFVLSYNVWYFTLRQAKAPAWQEVLLRGGTLIDGSGGKPYKTDLLIRGSRIVAIGEGIKSSPGARVIDVSGSLLVPGIVATWPGLLPTDQEQDEFVAAGVTTIIGGVDGNSPLDVKKYLNWATRSGLRINFGTLLGMGSLRGMMLTPRQMGPTDGVTLREGIKKGLSEGAVGLSLDFTKLPDAFWSWEEIGKVCADLHPVPLLVVNFSDEAYSEAGSLLPALQALIRAAGDTPFRPYLKSLRLPKSASASEIRAIQTELERASTTGVQIYGDLNPFHLAGRPRYLFDTAVGRFTPNDLIIAKTPPALQDLIGKSLAEAAREQGLPVFAMSQQLLGKTIQIEVEDTGGEGALAASPFFCWQAGYNSEQEEKESTIDPPNYLELLGQTEGYFGQLPLPEKVRRLTFLPARLFGLEGRGRIAVNSYADLLVLKKRGRGYAPDYVFVSGRPAVIKGHITRFKAGHVLVRS